MTPAQVEVAAARAHARGGVLVEVSGGVTLATIADYARAGADLISVGALTHSAPAVDIGLDVCASTSWPRRLRDCRLGSAPSIAELETCGSTNDEAARLARDNAPHGTVVIADSQRVGRGRDGRVWSSPPGSGLYMSVVLRPALPLASVPPADPFRARDRDLRRRERDAGAAAQLKWPNDVLVAGRKLAGILVETQSRGDRLDAIIAGIGVNLAAASTCAPATAIALAEADRRAGSAARPAISRRSLLASHRALDRPRTSPRGLTGGRPRLARAHGYRARLRAGDDDGVTVAGEAVGLDDDGALLVRDTEDRVHCGRSGDTSRRGLERETGRTVA